MIQPHALWKRMRLPLAGSLSSLAVFAAACGGGGGPAQAQPEGTPTSPTSKAATVAVESSKYGKVLVDGNGRALYLFVADKKGKSTCYDACANVWPPFTAPTGQPRAVEGAMAKYLGTIKRTTGATQVTYRGHPLYYYKPDQGSGSFKGQDIKSFGAEWYLLRPDGTKAEKKASGGGGGGY